MKEKFIYLLCMYAGGMQYVIEIFVSVFASPNYQAEDVFSSMTVHDGEGRSLISTLCIGVC